MSTLESQLRDLAAKWLRENNDTCDAVLDACADGMHGCAEELLALLASRASQASLTASDVQRAMDVAIKKVMNPDDAPNATIKHYIGRAQFQIMAEELNAALAAGKEVKSR
jgi:hypothetical protein